MKVRQVAELAKLAVSPGEEALLEQELQRMLGFVRQLQVEDLPGAEEEPEQAVLRQDEVRPSLQRAALLKLAPCCTEECFLVPKAIE